MIKFFENIRLMLIGVLKILLVSKYKNLHKKIKITNDEVIVLGNGPSLSDLLADHKFMQRLTTLDTVCVNSFCEHEFFSVIKPRYYVMVAPEYWEEDTKEYAVKIRNSIYDNLQKKVDWSMYLFIPWEAKKKKFWQDILKTNKNIKVVYFNIIPIEGGNRFKFFSFDMKFGLPRLHNVIGPTIMNMIWLGYKKIYLVGVEHSWLPQVKVDEDNVALVGQPHFYNKDAKPQKMNGVGGVGYRKLHEILHKFYLTFRGYFEVEDYARKNGVEILNMTRGSYIDAFKRMDIQEFLKA